MLSIPYLLLVDMAIISLSMVTSIATKTYRSVRFGTEFSF